SGVDQAERVWRTLGIAITGDGRPIHSQERDGSLADETAYHVEPFQISGLPAWTNSERFDVIARAADSNASVDQIRQMLQTLLADRFQLSLHRESRDLPTYSLVVAKNGPRLAKAKRDTCVGAPAEAGPCGGFRIFKRSQMWGNTVTVTQLAASD